MKDEQARAFVAQVSRLLKTSIDSSDDQLEGHVDALNRLITDARTLLDLPPDDAADYGGDEDEEDDEDDEDGED